MVEYKLLGDALLEGIALLKETNIENPSLDARILMCRTLSCDELYLTVHRDRPLTESEQDGFFSLIKRRMSNEPVGYITGTKEFMSLEFNVDKNVLIPRPDTEILVERVMSEVKSANPVIIDMCTGSGAIAVSLAKYIPNACVLGLDISEDALKVAKTNSQKNGADVTFEKHDVLKPYSKITADAVVSNPPYIPTDDLKGLMSDVIDFEPSIALDGGVDGLLFYRAIIKNIGSCLKCGGLLAFEVGAGQADDVAYLMEERFSSVTLEKDLAGIDRVVYGFFTPEKVPR